MTHSLTRRVDAETEVGHGPRPAIGRALAQALRALYQQLRAGFGGFEILSQADLADSAAMLATAQAEAAFWKARAASLENRIETLEERIAESESVAMGLRARLVCLHGKLATTASTARYQSFTMALKGRTPRS